MNVDMAKVRRESIRWTILLTLNNGRPTYLYEEVVLAVVQAVYPDASALEVRREMDYLDDRKLVSVVKEPGGRWRAELTHYGVDVAEYTVDCLPGIARPPKYW